ncbi:hypothetical protein TNCV_4992681 [Trichonephila clavipes]|nr:hypothetical protein TNCV_4992681 [Trichonephila clavipes]
MMAAVAECLGYRIVAGLVTSSSPVPLKTRHIGRTRYSGQPPNDTVIPPRTYQQVLDFTQDKLAILTLYSQRAHQTDFDNVIS